VTADGFAVKLASFMGDQQRSDDPVLEAGNSGSVRRPGSNLGNMPPQPQTISSGAEEPSTSKPLTPEEQMALYEKDLKENDWGHQPC